MNHNLALWAERSLARLGTPQARTWHAMGTREACHHHAIHMPRRATLVPPLCLWHANLVPRPAPLCAGRGAHLACPWRASGLSLTFTQPSLFAVAMLPTPKPMQLGPQKLNYCCSQQVDCWLGLPQDYGSTNSKKKFHLPLCISLTLVTVISLQNFLQHLLQISLSFPNPWAGNFKLEVRKQLLLK